MNDREQRLRQRIDELTEQRDQARARVAALERLVHRWRERTYEARRGRDFWKHRAMTKARNR